MSKSRESYNILDTISENADMDEFHSARGTEVLLQEENAISGDSTGLIDIMQSDIEVDFNEGVGTSAKKTIDKSNNKFDMVF